MDRFAQWLLCLDLVDAGRRCGGKRVISAPADGTVSWTAHDDIADAAATGLADEGQSEDQRPR